MTLCTRSMITTTRSVQSLTTWRSTTTTKPTSRWETGRPRPGQSILQNNAKKKPIRRRNGFKPNFRTGAIRHVVKYLLQQRRLSSPYMRVLTSIYDGQVCSNKMYGYHRSLSTITRSLSLMRITLSPAQILMQGLCGTCRFEISPQMIESSMALACDLQWQWQQLMQQ